MEEEKVVNTAEAEIIQRNYVEEIVTLITTEKDLSALKEQLGDYHESDVADALPLLTKQDRLKLYKLLGDEAVSEIFAYLEDPQEYFEELSTEKLADIIEEMDASDAVDVLDELESDMREQIIELLDEESAKDIELITAYDEDKIGSKMSTNYVAVEQSFSIKQAMRSVIAQAAENDNISTVYVTDENGVYAGAFSLRDLVIARSTASLDDIIVKAYPHFYADDLVSNCVERLKDLSEDSIPILSDKNRILGVITALELVEVVDEELAEDYAKFAGLTEEEDLTQPAIKSVAKRIPWLIILMGLGLIVSSVIGLFDPIINAIPYIFYFQTLILNMSGNCGTQSLAVTIRVLTSEELTAKSKWRLIFKEFKVGLINGFVIGLLTMLVTALYLWLGKDMVITQSFAISGCIGLSLMTAMIVSSLSGTVIPLLLKKAKVDPAVASGPMITTLNDLIAASVYYGLAYLFIIGIFGMYAL